MKITLSRIAWVAAALIWLVLLWLTFNPRFVD